MIKCVDSEVKRIENKLNQSIEQQADWAEKRDILISASGVGDTLVYTLLADMPKLSSLTNKQAASLVGVVPINTE